MKKQQIDQISPSDRRSIMGYGALAASNYQGHRIEIDGKSHGWQKLRELGELSPSTKFHVICSRIDSTTLLYKAKKIEQ